MHHSLRSLFLVGGLTVTLLAQAESGVTSTEIRLGQSAAFTGPTAVLGTGMRDGLLTAFAEINATGGVHGRKVKLVAKDDGYEPERARTNVMELLQQDNAFLIIGGVGTPTAMASVPVCEEAKAPFLAPFSGALRRPFNPLVIHLRASYEEEVERLVQYLVDEHKLTKIACLRQDDGFGQVGLNALKASLATRHLTVAAVGSYARNTTQVQKAEWEIGKADPEAVLMIGTHAACAEFVKLGRKNGMTKAIYCSISFAGTRALIQATGVSDAEGLIASQVVPNPVTSKLPIVRAYAAALKSYDANLPLDPITFEGYLAGRLFAELAHRAGKDLTRASFLASVASPEPIDLGGFILTYGPGRNQGSNEVFLTRVHDGVCESPSL